MAEGCEEIKKFLEQCLAIAGFSAEEIKVRDEGETLAIDLSAADAGLLIGEDGKHISAWEQVLRAASEKLCGRRVRVSFDINHYRAMKDETFREIARKAAREAVLKKKPVELQPMNAYERRIVHSELALRPDVETESIGEEPNRRVVVKRL